MMRLKFVTGDDNQCTVQCLKNTVPVAISLAAEVRAQLNSDEGEVSVGPVDCFSNAAGANWPAGIVAIEFPAALSATMPVGLAEIEIEILSGGKRTTYFADFVEVREGHLANTATPDPLAAIGASIYNVQWFGAIGDGINDDTEAIQDAINAAEADGGGTVYLPRGTYLVEGSTSAGSSVTISTAFEIGSTSIKIVGEGMDQSRIKSTTNYPIRFFKNQASSVTDFSISDLTIEGNDLGDFAAGIALAFERFDNVLLDRCQFLNLTGGVMIGANDVAVQSGNLRVTHCVVDGQNIVTASVLHVYNCAGVHTTQSRFNRCARVLDIETDTARSVSDISFVANEVTNGDRATRTGNESCIPVHIDIEDTSEAIRGIISDNIFTDCHDDSSGSLAGGIIALDHNGTKLLAPILVVGDAGTDKFTKVGHGLTNGMRIRLVDAGSLPTGLNSTTAYYIVAADADTFQVSLTLGGAAELFSSNGTNVVAVRAAIPDHTTDTFTVTAHGLTAGRPVRFFHSGTMPAGLFKKRRYWVINPTTDTFQVSLTRGGAALTFTDDGSGVLTVESPCMMHSWTITGNVISGHRSNATSNSIWVDNGDGVTITGNILTEAQNASMRGIIIRDSAHCTIKGNVVDESYGTGLREMTGCRKNLWQGNRCGNKTFDDAANSLSTDADNLTGSTGI